MNWLNDAIVTTLQDKEAELIAIENEKIMSMESVTKMVQSIPQIERDTWPLQEKEARAYEAAKQTDPTGDHSALIPFVMILANERGIDVDELVSRIIVKADAYATAAFVALGKKHKLEDELSNVGD